MKNSFRKIATDAARAASMAVHQAAGLAVAESRTAARLIRTAEGLIKTAVDVLLTLDVEPPRNHAGNAPAAASSRRRRPRGKKGKGQPPADNMDVQQHDEKAADDVPGEAAVGEAPLIAGIGTGVGAAAAAAASSNPGTAIAATAAPELKTCANRGSKGKRGRAAQVAGDVAVYAGSGVPPVGLEAATRAADGDNQARPPGFKSDCEKCARFLYCRCALESDSVDGEL